MSAHKHAHTRTPHACGHAPTHTLFAPMAPSQADARDHGAGSLAALEGGTVSSVPTPAVCNPSMDQWSMPMIGAFDNQTEPAMDTRGGKAPPPGAVPPRGTGTRERGEEGMSERRGPAQGSGPNQGTRERQGGRGGRQGAARGRESEREGERSEQPKPKATTSR